MDRTATATTARVVTWEYYDGAPAGGRTAPKRAQPLTEAAEDFTRGANSLGAEVNNGRRGGGSTERNVTEKGEEARATGTPL